MPIGANLRNAQSINHHDGTRVQALPLAEAGIATRIVTALTEVSRQTIKRLPKQACDRGYDPVLPRNSCYPTSQISLDAVVPLLLPPRVRVPF